MKADEVNFDMADEVNEFRTTLVGDQLPGDRKWQGGVLVADGNSTCMASRARYGPCCPRFPAAIVVPEQG